MTVVNDTPVSRDAQEEERFRRLPDTERYIAAITAHVEYVRRQNDPAVIEKMSETEFWRFCLEAVTRNMTLKDTGPDLKVELHAVTRKDVHTMLLALRKLASSVPVGVNRPRMPHPHDPVWTFLKDLRRDRGGA